MALSFSAVQEAYKVFNQLELKHIGAFPPDFFKCDDYEQKNPTELKVYGYKKIQDGWDELFFFVKNPSDDFIEKWNELKESVPNTSMSHIYKENPEYRYFGWF